MLILILEKTVKLLKYLESSFGKKREKMQERDGIRV